MFLVPSIFPLSLSLYFSLSLSLLLQRFSTFEPAKTAFCIYDPRVQPVELNKSSDLTEKLYLNNIWQLWWIFHELKYKNASDNEIQFVEISGQQLKWNNSVCVQQIETNKKLMFFSCCSFLLLLPFTSLSICSILFLFLQLLRT